MTLLQLLLHHSRKRRQCAFKVLLRAGLACEKKGFSCTTSRVLSICHLTAIRLDLWTTDPWIHCRPVPETASFPTDAGWSRPRVATSRGDVLHTHSTHPARLSELVGGPLASLARQSRSSRTAERLLSRHKRSRATGWRP